MDQFKNVDGKRVLSLKRTELISAFGKVEGSRLDGHIDISRETTRYDASSELRNVLAKAKKRADEERRESIRQAYTDNDFQSAA